MASTDPVIRALRPGYELRDNADGGKTLTGHFAVFNEFTEINSMWEGNFMERIAPGAFKKTFREQTPKVLFQHGADPQIGDKPLGTVSSLHEDERGAYYEVDLLDTQYNRELVPGLQAGLYGASFRFRVMREETVDEPAPSDLNPRGLPERTIREAQVMEFGPVTFPAYAGATSGIRSMTDEFRFLPFTGDPDRLREILEFYLEARDETRSRPTIEVPTLEVPVPPAEEARRDDSPQSVTPQTGRDWLHLTHEGRGQLPNHGQKETRKWQI